MKTNLILTLIAFVTPTRFLQLTHIYRKVLPKGRDSFADDKQFPWRRALITCTIVVILSLLRRPDAFLNPQFWAEDGVIFFLGNEQNGLRAAIEPYAGYLHLIPRLIAWCSTPFSPHHSPAFFNAAALVSQLLVIMRLFSPRLLLPGKVWLAIAVALVPHSGEVFVNVTNVQWITVFFLIQTLLMTEASSWPGRAIDVGTTLLVGLTGPFSIILAPLFFWRCWERRSWLSYVLFGIIASCACVQAWFILHASLPFDYSEFSIVKLLAILGRRSILHLLLGSRHQAFLNPTTTAIFSCLLLVALVIMGLWHREWRREKLMLWLCFGAMTAAVAFRSRFDLWNFEDFGFGDRYLYGPRILLLWLLVLELSSEKRRLLGGALILFVVLVNASQFRFQPFHDYRWGDYSESIKRGQAVSVPINPNWTIEYPGRRHK